MSLDQLPINFFDALLIVVLIAGINRGRKHGMSEELMSLLTWLTILFGCACLPTGRRADRAIHQRVQPTVLLPDGLYHRCVAGIPPVCGDQACHWAANCWGATFLDGRSIIWAWGRGWCALAACLLTALALLNAALLQPAPRSGQWKRAISIYMAATSSRACIPSRGRCLTIPHGPMDQGEPRLPADRTD